MLDSTKFQAYMIAQGEEGLTIPQTLKTMGLDICPDQRPEGDDGEEGMTEDEKVLAAIASSGMNVVMEQALGTGNMAVMRPETFVLQGLLMGLALGYSQGSAEAATLEVQDTIPTDWPEAPDNAEG